MNKKEMIFSDGSYIESNASGLVYVGVIANECGHIIRKVGGTIAEFKIAYNNMLEIEKAKLLKTN